MAAATVLALGSAVLHAAWNLLVKTSSDRLIAAWGLLAALTSPRTAIAVAGVLLLATPLLLPRREHTAQHGRELAPERT